MSGYTIEIPENMLKDLKTFAKRNDDIPLEEAAARAFALLAIANSASEQHYTLGVIKKSETGDIKDDVVIGEIKGI